MLFRSYLNGIFIFPFGTEIAAFISALTTGIITIGLGYFFDHSAVMQKIWSFLNILRDKYEDVRIKFREINTELDRYLKELTAVEFNMDANQLLAFADSLYTCNSLPLLLGQGDGRRGHRRSQVLLGAQRVRQ